MLRMPVPAAAGLPVTLKFTFFCTMEKTLVPGKTYTVTTSSECSVTDSNGLVLCTASAGEQKAFVATTPTIIFSDDSASVVAVFKSAPAALGMLGGGNSGGSGGGELTASCKRVEFLESTSQQAVDLRYVPNAQTGVRLTEYRTVLAGTYTIGCRNSHTSATRWFAPGQSNSYTVFVGWGEWITQSIPTTPTKKVTTSLNWKNSNMAVWGDYSYELGELSFEPNVSLYLFEANYGMGPNPASTRIFKVEISQGEKVVRSFVPALSEAGEPCMFDTVTKSLFYNMKLTGLIVGLNLTQARNLTLPATGGSLTISLPAEIVAADGNVTDSAVLTALDTAAENGWTITIQTYTEN